MNDMNNMNNINNINNINNMNNFINNYDILINNLEPLIKFDLLKHRNNKSLNDNFNPLFKMLTVYTNLKDGTNIDIPNGLRNIDLWHSMVSEKFCVEYLLRHDVQFIISAIIIYNKNYSKRKFGNLDYDDIITKLQKFNI